ncbi:MAG: phosphatase PAP2-related protein [Candidatus Methylomirabilales bacterium]
MEGSKEASAPQTISKVARAAITVGAIAAWFVSQSLLESRGFPDGIVDGVHIILAPVTAWLANHTGAAQGLLIVTSGLIDILGCFLFLFGILGRSVRPLLGLMLLFILRQISQVLVALPPPLGMIWDYPGVPSLFVTYGTTNDFFFSGHTAIAVYGAIELARFRRPWLTVAGTVVAVIEATTVLVLRAHYTMDVFTAILAAALAGSAATRLAPAFDRLLAGRPAYFSQTTQ